MTQTKVLEEIWKETRHGAWAARGFNYQHLVTTLIAIYKWTGLLPPGYLVPEGQEDCVIEYESHDLWLQIKSRKDGTFSLSEAESFFQSIEQKNKELYNPKRTKPFLVLEQSCEKLPQITIDQLSTLSSKRSIIVCKNPDSLGLALLKQRLDSADSVLESLFNCIYVLVTNTAVSNASLKFEQRKRITVTDVDHLILEHLQSHDPSAIDEALLNRFIEPIDFKKSIYDPGFYQGVKVHPGHISAGFVLDRPYETKLVIQHLSQGRSVLVTGPSGAGKSALVWLTVFELSQKIRWYKVGISAAPQNANAIVKFIKARRPKAESAIGIVFDDVGSNNSSLWEILSKELESLSNVFLIGSIRHEDLDLLSNRADTSILKIELDEKLAERLWKKLEDQTTWQHWREAFEQSEGLLLEYVHILTKGKRLKELIRDQMLQRTKENREDELAIVRAASALFAYGAEIDAQRLIESLNIPPEKGSKALKRLIDEHLIREKQPGVLGGLHSLRSEALCESTHDEIIYLRNDSVWKSIHAVTYDSLPQIVRLVISNEPKTPIQTKLEKLRDVVSGKDDLDLWIGILTGLGYASLELQVDYYIDCLNKQNVSLGLFSLASMFVDVDTEFPDLSSFEQGQNLQNSVSDFRNLPKADFRYNLFEILEDKEKSFKITTFHNMNRFLSSLVSTTYKHKIVLPMDMFSISQDKINIKDIYQVLLTAYTVNSELASAIVNSLGGEEKLLDLIYCQTPWITRPIFIDDSSGHRTVKADLYGIEEKDNKYTNDEMVNICELLISASPSANNAACNFIDPSRNLIKVGDISWSKNIARRNLPAKSRIAWNAAFRQIFIAKTCADSLTDYAKQIGDLVIRTEKVFRKYTERWIRGGSISQADKIAGEINSIVTSVNQLAYAKPGSIEPDMTNPERLQIEEEPTGSLLTGILGNLIPRISNLKVDSNCKPIAGFAGDLAIQAEERIASPIWRVTDNPPGKELQKIQDRLINLSNILHEMDFKRSSAFTIDLVVRAKKGGMGNFINTAARFCRSQATSRLNMMSRKLINSLKEQGWIGKCWFRYSDDKTDVYWPACELAITIDILDFEHQANWFEDVINISESVIKSRNPFYIAPVVNGKVIADLAMVKPLDTIFPCFDFREKWEETINLTFLDTKYSTAFDKVVTALQRISAIVACRKTSNLHKDEENLYQQAINDLNENYKIIDSFFEETQNDALLLAIDYLNELHDILAKEIDLLASGGVLSDPLYADMYSFNETEKNRVLQLGAIRILLRQMECYMQQSV